MPIFELIILCFLAAGIWLWLDGLRARESAMAAAHQACADEGWQLLDETVCLRRMRPARDEESRFCWRRDFEFEFSDTGDNRRRGWVTLRGREVEMLNLGLRLVSG